MNQFSQTNISQQLSQCEHLLQQLMQQTQQASGMYQQLLKQEQANAAQLEQIAQREHQAAHIIQTSLQGHQKAMQQMQQISSICNQISSSNANQSFAYQQPQYQGSSFGELNH
ncbi:hypothetical protein [Paenibacillus sp. Leaf72]|uniref:hypothetical protein n=1 Tax=Paenibacillus sp. Leaf72 TaxID=1736234 RepID=UPI000701F2DD|nr:hypothetical protein [Paenibacillus sp. Leaf72]KQO01285.1 hypothetical protein ASF12_15740 [Paenibacillus sp. Leaf72]